MNDEKYLELSLISERYAMEKCGFCGAEDYNLTRNKKFAELIIKECASIAGKAEYSDTWTEPVEDTIKKHFGVE
jgi:hypothetical protein